MLTSQSRLAGFTLIELMVTLSVIAIIAAIAAPNFSDLMRQQRLTTQANNIFAMLQLARSEAVNRGVRVTIRSCGPNNSQWENGALIFTDLGSGDNLFVNTSTTNQYCSKPETVIPECKDDTECLLQIIPPLANGLTLRTESRFATNFSFLASGTITANDTFRLCDRDASGENNEFSRDITITRTGNARISQTAKSCP